MSARDKRYPFRVYLSAFHGGKLISRHATEQAAETAARRLRMTDCVCGCAYVVSPDQTRIEAAWQDD